METTADVRMTEIILRPLDDQPVITFSLIESALGMFLASTSSNVLDEGQELMVNEAMKRLSQVADELGAVPA